MSSTKRHRRSPEEMIADLEAQVARIKERSERHKATRDPTLRHVSAALRSIDKALAVSEDVATRQGLDEARGTLAAILTLNGAPGRATSGQRAGGRGRSARAQVDEGQVLKFLAAHPGSRSEDIAAALGTDTKDVSPVVKRLKADGKVRSEGQARGMRYYAGSPR